MLLRVPLLAFGLLVWGFPLRAEEWSPDVFDYDPPVKLTVRQAETRRAYNLSGTRQEEVFFKDIRGHEVPVLITRPATGDGPFPVVVLVHGFASNKEGVSRQLSRPLTDRGFATMAMDMPNHGERPGKPPKNMFGPDRKAAFENIVQAVKDVRQTIDLAETRRELDTSNGVYLAGYSMGAWMGTLAAAADRRVKAMVVMVGGSAVTGAESRSKEGPGNGDRLDLVHEYAVLRHNLALPKFSPRPVLLMNGRKDPLVPPERAKLLYESARQPKEQRWYDSGHLLPSEAYRDAAEWLARQVKRVN